MNNPIGEDLFACQDCGDLFGESFAVLNEEDLFNEFNPQPQKEEKENGNSQDQKERQQAEEQ